MQLAHITSLILITLHRPIASRHRRAPRQDLVQGALPARTTRQGQGLIPEAAEVLCTERAQTQTAQATEEEVGTIRNVCVAKLTKNEFYFKDLHLGL